MFRFELILSFWVDFVILDRTPNIGPNVILLFWVNLVVHGGLRHTTTLTFWAEFLILGRFFHSGLNLSFRTKFFIWVEFVIPG